MGSVIGWAERSRNLFPVSIALSLLLGFLIVFLITAATAFFVAQEFAYMAVDRTRLQAAAARGDGQATRTLAITGRTSFMLSGAQLGITVTGLLVGYVAEPLIGESLARLLGSPAGGSGGTGGGSSGWLSWGVALAVGSTVALLFSTFVQMLVGELLPKNYAIARSEPVARRLATPTRIYLAVFGPLIWVFDRAAESFLRLVGVTPVHDVEQAVSAPDLVAVVEESMESGELSRELSILLDRILDFPNHDVEHAMVPRGRVDVVAPDATIGQVRFVMATGHTRYPVIDQDDDIVGVVHLKDLLPRTDVDTPIAEVARPAVIVHELMDLPDALRALRSADEELACVVDEYGSFTGIVTIEDLAEEIVGELLDEHDEHARAEVVVVDGQGWLVAGDAHVDEVERALWIDLPPGPYETISGLVVDHHKVLPAVGDVVVVELPLTPDDLVRDDPPPRRHLHAEVIEVSRHVPSRLRLTVPDPSGTQMAQEGA